MFVIDAWVVPVYFLIVCLSVIAIRFGEDAALVLLVRIDSKSDEILESNMIVAEKLDAIEHSNQIIIENQKYS